MKINKEWTLFLDRDGVINRRLEGSYVLSREQFEFLPGVLPSVKWFSNLFGRICIISNQQGVGKGLMTEDELFVLHEWMINQIENAGGRIDAVYCCTKLESDLNNCRKPLPYMAFQAQKDFPDIVFAKTIMAGDSSIDIEFGKNIGAFTVFIGQKTHTFGADFAFEHLAEFAEFLKENT